MTTRLVVVFCFFLAVHMSRAQVVSPRLEIQWHSFNQVQLRWATNAAGFVLDQTDRLSVSQVWQLVAEERQIEGGKFVVAITASNSSRFFRLREGSLRPDGDEDDDGLLNTNEIAHGTGTTVPDTDGDGWTDGVEVADGTDPLNPNSTPRTWFVGRPPLDVVLPSFDEIGTTGTGLTMGGPPVEAVFPSIDEVDSSLGVTIGRPPVEAVFPAFDEIDATGGLTIGRPPVEVVFPSLDEVDSSSGVTVGLPLLEIRFPSLDEIDSVATGITLGRPPVSIRYVPQP